MTLSRVASSLFAIAFALSCQPAAFAQHPVGSEWPCAACGAGQVCYRQNIDFTSCRVPQGSHVAPRAPDMSRQIAQATARIQQNPRDPNAWVTRAVYYMTLGPGGVSPPLHNLEHAVSDLETALKITPNDFYALHNYGQVAYLLDFDDFAIYEFRKAIAVNPGGSARSYMGIGWAYYEECKFNDAVANFNQAVRMDRSLESQIAGPQKIQQRRQECANIQATARYWAAHPIQSQSPGLGAMYQRNEAISRANSLDSSGNHDAARIVRQENGVP
jgi:tetratricopeptide (TPR) repeat protein